MKLSEFKEALKERLVLLRASLIFTAQRELAYTGNNWASVLSTMAYTVSVLIFIKVIYANVQLVAGYSYNDMLFFFFISQLTYYANYMVTIRNLNDLIADVNKGNLDMVLVKPVPSLFYLMTRSVSLVSIITDALAPTLAIIFSINWLALKITLPAIMIGFVVWIMGLVAIHTFQLLAGLVVFWVGESENVLDLASNMTAASGSRIPFEGYNRGFQILLGTVVPMLIAGGFTTSILLGKSNSTVLLVWALVVGIGAFVIRGFAWRLALKHYTSASS